MAEKIEILWTNRAKKDLKNIYEFSCQTIEEPKAFDIVTKLIDKVEVLYSFPLIGQKEPKFEQLKHHYRRLILSYYKIIYQFL